MNVRLSRVALGAIAFATALSVSHSEPAFAGPKPSKLVFVEATYHPRNTPNWHWLELYNGTSSRIDLSTYVVDNARGAGSYYTAPNLKGLLLPGKVAILYSFGALKGSCKTEAGCQAFFKQAWPNVPDDALFVPVEGLQFPTIWRQDQVISLWSSFDDYKAETQPVDLRLTPKKAVTFIKSNAKTFEAYDKRADRTTEPTLVLTNLLSDPTDPANWSFSTAGAGGAYRSTKNNIPSSDENGGADVGSPGQLP